MLLFLDIDGVLNNHRITESGYTTIDEERCRTLNELLVTVPRLEIAISSAWRYMILNGEVTVKGFEYMLLKSGLNCKGRLIGCTGPDPVFEPDHSDAENWSTNGLKFRAIQINEFLMDAGHPRYAVLDDLPLPVANLVQTDHRIGITQQDVKKAKAILCSQ